MKRKGLVGFFIVALIAANVFLSIQLYSANRQIAVLTVEREKYMMAAASLSEALSSIENINILSREEE